MHVFNKMFSFFFEGLRCCATNRKVAGSIPAGVSGFFIDIKSFPSHYGPGVDSASNRNEYQEYFLGGKGGRCVRLTTLPPSCAVVTKSGNLNFLEPCSGLSRPVMGMLYLYLYNLRVTGNKGLRWIHVVVTWGYILLPSSSQIRTLNIDMNLQCNESL
jgi:hypothetical protein